MPATIQTALLRATPEWRAQTMRPARRTSAVSYVAPRPAPAALEAELISTETAFAALAGEWNRLAAEVPDACLAQGFAWCWAGWCSTGRPRGRRLAVITVREAGRLVLVWPMAQRGRGLLAELIPLGSEATDYNPLLVARSLRAETYVRAAVALMQHETEAGLVTMPLVRD